jgi:hypothetical protein
MILSYKLYVIMIYLNQNQKSNSNTVWFNFQTYIIFSINLVSQVTLRSSGTDILYGCHLLRCLYNILFFLWLYNEFFIILCNILKIAELDCCQIIILIIYVPSTHSCLMSISRFSLQDKVTLRQLKLYFLYSGCGQVVYGAWYKSKRFVLQCINGVSSNPVEGRTKNCQLKDLILTLFGLIVRRIYIFQWII